MSFFSAEKVYPFGISTSIDSISYLTNNQGGHHMALEQQFLQFLVSQIESKAQTIAKQTQGESTKFTAEELQVHIKELKKAIETLFDTLPKGNTRKKGSDA
jgi:hypothetical protein